MATNPNMNPSAFGKSEIPNEMRSFAEQSVEQARRAVDGFITASQKAAGALEGSATAAQEGARDVRQKAVSFAEQNVATSFDSAQRLVRARDLDEIMRLQAEFVQAQMVALTQQAQELGQTAVQTATKTAKAGS